MNLPENILTRYGNPQLSKRLRWAKIAALLSLGGLLLTLLLIFNRVVSSEQWVEHSHEVRLTIERTMHALATAETTQRRFLMIHDIAALAPYDDAKITARASAAILPNLVADNPAQYELAKRLLDHVEQRILQMEQTILLAKAGQYDRVTEEVRTGYGYKIMAEARKIADEVQAIESLLLKERAAAVQHLRKGFIAGGILLGLGLALMLSAIFRQALQAAEHERLIRGDLMSALKERTALLHELNHRVGNSLMMVASLIEMQARQANTPELADAFQTARARVAAVGQVHRRLQKSETVTSLDFSDYLHALCEDIEQTLLDAEGRIDVIGESMDLPIETVVPLGLIVNELVTNAIRHGYQNQPEGKVTVQFTKTAEGLDLYVRDWGKGVPDDFNPATSKGLGISVICALIAQLNGTLSFTADKGTEAHISVPAAA